MQPPFARKDSERLASSTNLRSSNLGSSVMSNGEQTTPSRAPARDPLGDVQPPPGPPPGSPLMSRNRYRGRSSFTEASETSAAGPQRSLDSQANGIPQIQEPMEPQTQGATSESSVGGPALVRDADGFAVPPPPTDPISQAQAQRDTMGCV